MVSSSYDFDRTWDFYVLIDGNIVSRHRRAYSVKNGVRKAKKKLRDDGNTGNIMIQDVGAGLLCTPEYIEALNWANVLLERCLTHTTNIGTTIEETIEEFVKTFETGGAKIMPVRQ
ncbi:MAG: hypothetical protein SWK76_00180 [Actinomycetota bacterium]|nr:hypothetical protein [Actinomycetota bacterium]